MEKTFEEFLMYKHAEQHIGTKETLVDGFNDWLIGLELDEIIEYADQFSISREQKISKEIDKLISEKGQSWDPASGLGPDVVLVDDLEVLKKQLS